MADAIMGHGRDNGGVGGGQQSGLLTSTGPRDFADAYRHFRHEGETVRDNTHRLIPDGGQWLTSLVARFTTSDEDTVALFGTQPITPSAGHSAREGGYTLIRSDIEDEETTGPRNGAKGKTNTMPTMPVQQSLMRQRTLQNFNLRDTGKKEQVQKPLAWVNADWFQWICGTAIVINALVVGMETDMESPLFVIAEEVLLTFFCLELLLRIAHHGFNFFTHEEDSAWHAFDTAVVMIGVADQWVVPVLQGTGRLPQSVAADKVVKDSTLAGETDRNNILLMMITMLRYLRIIRVFRLVRMIRPLYVLAQGVLEALQGMFWVLVFVVMTLYSMAILCTRMIGHGQIIPDDLKDDPEVQQIQGMFLSVQESMFTLFGTISSWSLLKFVPLFEESPVFKPMFVLFYVYSAWALLAVMTGVVSENMIAIREQMIKEDQHREEMRKSMITNMLHEVFREADVDRSGTVSRHEFDAMLRNPTITQKIAKNTHLKVQDLQDLFDYLDHDGGGTITIDEFMTGFKWVNEPLRAKSLVKLQERLLTDLYDMAKGATANLEHRVTEVQKLVTAPLRKVHAITEQMQSLDGQFARLRGTLSAYEHSTPTPERYAMMEGRLMTTLGSAMRKLEDLDVNKKRKDRFTTTAR